jgi:hypothetical protein
MKDDARNHEREECSGYLNDNGIRNLIILRHCFCNEYSTDKNRLQCLKVQCSSTFMIRAAESSKMFVPVYQNTRHHIPEQIILYIVLHDNLKFHALI